MTLLEYVKDVKKLEENIYICGQLMQNMKNKLAKKALETAELQPLPVSAPKKPEYEEYPDNKAEIPNWARSQLLVQSKQQLSKETKEYPNLKNVKYLEYPLMPDVPKLKSCDFWVVFFELKNWIYGSAAGLLFCFLIIKVITMFIPDAMDSTIMSLPIFGSFFLGFFMTFAFIKKQRSAENRTKEEHYKQQMLEYEEEYKKIDTQNSLIKAEFQREWDEVHAYNIEIRKENEAKYAKIKRNEEEKKQKWYEARCVEVDMINRARRNGYEKAMEQYRADVKASEEACERKKQQNRIVYKALMQEFGKVEELQQKLTTVLKRAYAADIIYPKYRALIPVTMFAEYLEAGRCDSLTGQGGAYNLYENELLANRIINKLDEISAKLDSVRENQYSLYESMERMNRQIGLVTTEIEKQGDRLAAKLSEQNELIEKNGRLLERRNELLEDQNWIASEHSRMVERGMEHSAEIQRASAEKQNDLLYESNELRKYSNSVMEDIRRMQEVDFILNLP